ncbi:MAG: hypothetical protein JXR70_14550 [Spirochaetales bacterium]|nr:hypothetical protein [Spirochaetales bacterium]
MLRKNRLLILIMLFLFSGSIMVTAIDSNIIVFGSEKGAVIGSEFKISGLINTLDDTRKNPVSMTISFDPALAEIDRSKGIDGIDIMMPVTDLVINTSTPGQIYISAAFVEHLTSFMVYFKALTSGTSPITLFTIPENFRIETIAMSIVEYGDVNADRVINIVDSLLVAQYYVDMKGISLIVDAGDVNCDGLVNIIDSLLIAQYYIGQLKEFPLCKDNITPTPLSSPDNTPTPSPGSYIPRDVNDDGIVNIIDCIIINQYLKGLDVTINEEAADANHDGVITADDATIICSFEIIIQ